MEERTGMKRQYDKPEGNSEEDRVRPPASLNLTGLSVRHVPCDTSTYDVNTRTADGGGGQWERIVASVGSTRAQRALVSSPSPSVVWVMKYHRVRSATCHCKGLGRVLTRRTRATPSNSERRSVRSTHLFSIRSMRSFPLPPLLDGRWHVIVDLPARKRRRGRGGDEGEQRLRAVSPEPLSIL